MKNVLLVCALAGTCSPSQPQTTDSGPTTGETTSTTTSNTLHPTTEVMGSTSAPSTDDPVTTVTPTTTTLAPTSTGSSTATGGEEPCANAGEPVMCGNEPCKGPDDEPVCLVNGCDPTLCLDCPEATLCGETSKGLVCVVNGEVPCQAACTTLPCEECPDQSCMEQGEPLCLNPVANTPACVQDLLYCAELDLPCLDDTQCSGNAPICIGGNCRAGCATGEDCGLGSSCFAGIMCVDGEQHPVCKVKPPPPVPPCMTLGQCSTHADCPKGAGLCWDFVKGAPTSENGGKGQCVAYCDEDQPCDVGHTCNMYEFCVDDRDKPVCVEER